MMRYRRQSRLRPASAALFSGALFALCAQLIGCATSGLSHVVDDDILRDMSRQGQISIYDAENEIVVALDRADEAQDRLATIKRQQTAAVRSIEAANKRNSSLATSVAEKRLAYLEQLGLRFDHLKFRDHHNFTAAEHGELKNRQPVLTTEKDATRLEGALDELWVLPVAHCFPPRDAAVMQRFLSQF